MQDKLTLPFSKKQALCVVIPVSVIALLAFMTYFFSDTSTQWYLDLIKPQIMPGETVFLIVWGILYILLAFVYSIVSLKIFSQKTLILMLLNGLFIPFRCLVFFTMYHAFAALFIILAMITAAIYLAYTVYPVRPLVSYLMLPYILWLAFNITLNYQIAVLN